MPREARSAAHYNLTITFVSVVAALIIGGVEALGLIGDKLGLKGPSGTLSAPSATTWHARLRDRRALHRELANIFPSLPRKGTTGSARKAETDAATVMEARMIPARFFQHLARLS